MTAPHGATDVLAWLHATAPAARLSSDSREIASGDVFFAYPGDAADGRNYIQQAVEKGAAAVIYEADDFDWNDAWQVPHLAVKGLKRQAGPIANGYYRQPDAAMFSIAVTGTNGKTSCAQWLGSALSRLNGVAVVVGTLGISRFEHGIASVVNETGYTTPDAVLLQRRLAELRDAGATALAIEASSIGLDQGRLNGMHIDVALFTNFTRDHLDYHHDMTAYEAAKAMLFDWPGLQHAVINLDDAMGLRLIQRLRQRSVSLIGYTIAGVAEQDVAPSGVAVLQASAIRTNAGGTVFHVSSPFGSAQVKTRLVGQFNVSNVLGIMGVLLAKGMAWTDVVAVVETLTPPPGRMQQFGGQDAPLVVIDYAHTPDALEKALATLRQVAQERNGELWCVFGCGGDRDPGKRPQMGAVAQGADHVIVTSDNPRSENPSDIIEQIIEGMNPANDRKDTAQMVEDRAAAILWAVKHAARHDVVLLAGKGHETYQEIKGKKTPFLDADHAALALATRAMKGAN